MEKINQNKHSKKSQEKPEADALEKEIDELIDREKTKSKIVNKLLNLKKPVEKEFDFP